MSPTAPAATPITSNTNMPFGGFGQSQQDYSSAAGLLANLPGQESQTVNNSTNVNNNPGSILPNISVNAPVYNAPTAPTVNAGSFGSNLTGYNSAVQQAMQGLTSGENATYSSALGQLSSAEQQYGNLTPVYQQLASTYNIPGYQQDVATLSGLLQNLNQDVNARTTLGGGAITESARDEAYTNQAQPLNLALNNASEFLNFGQQDVGNLLDTYEKSLGNALNPLETNISNLPTLFGQTNEAAQTGYGQGATAIENTIQNQQEQEKINQQNYYNSLFAKQVNEQVGSGNLSSIFNGGSQSGTGQFTGVSFKNPTQLGGGGYNFAVNGKPASAVTWAAHNGQSPSAVIAYMAQNGDTTAGQAYQALLTNPNMSLTELAQKFPSLAWGVSQPGTTTKQPSAPGGMTTEQIQASNGATPFSGPAGGLSGALSFLGL